MCPPQPLAEHVSLLKGVDSNAHASDAEFLVERKSEIRLPPSDHTARRGRRCPHWAARCLSPSPAALGTRASRLVPPPAAPA